MLAGKGMTEPAESTQARHAIPSDLAAFMYSLWHEAILGQTSTCTVQIQ